MICKLFHFIKILITRRKHEKDDSVFLGNVILICTFLELHVLNLTANIHSSAIWFSLQFLLDLGSWRVRNVSLASLNPDLTLVPKD